MKLDGTTEGLQNGMLTLLSLLLLSAFVACSESGMGPDAEDHTPQISPVEIHVLSGADQEGLEGYTLGEPVVVRVTDGSGDPAEGVALRFSVVHGGGRLHRDGVPPHSTLVVHSDREGLAQVSWTLGNSPEHVLKVSILPGNHWAENPFSGRPKYVFAGMDSEMSIQWTRGHEFITPLGAIPHDDRILETQNFLVFSDGSSDDAKVVLASMAEESLREILTAFEVSGTEAVGVDQTDPDTKLTIYSSYNVKPGQVAFSFRFGFFAAGMDSGIYSSLAGMRYVVKHELMHVFRMLVDFRFEATEGWWHLWSLDTWFAEGLCEHVAGGSQDPILTLDEMNIWRAHPDHTNPISIRQWAFFPESVIQRSNGYEYYPMFDLAVRYLLDEEGLGKDYSDVMAMFMEMEVTGAGFLSAFEKHMGISADDFEESFYDLMADYLPPP